MNTGLVLQKRGLIPNSSVPIASISDTGLNGLHAAFKIVRKRTLVIVRQCEELAERQITEEKPSEPEEINVKRKLA